MERSPEYRVWIDMRRRCKQPQRPDYKNYGARGITVCARWRDDFGAFYQDLGPRPAGHTLERRDNNRGYEPGNVTWAPRAAQERNKRSNHRITVRGEEMTVVEASERFNIGYMTLANRINTLGWDPERAALTPVGRKRGEGGRFIEAHSAAHQ